MKGFLSLGYGNQHNRDVEMNDGAQGLEGRCPLVKSFSARLSKPPALEPGGLASSPSSTTLLLRDLGISLRPQFPHLQNGATVVCYEA